METFVNVLYVDHFGYYNSPCNFSVDKRCDVMGETLRVFQSNKKLDLRISATQNFPKSRLFGELAKKSSKKTLKCVTSMKVSMVASGDIGVFLLTTAVLEIVRKLSSAHCPFFWRGLQALQILCCPPFKWIEKWAPFTSLVKGMQVGFTYLPYNSTIH